MNEHKLIELEKLIEILEKKATAVTAANLSIHGTTLKDVNDIPSSDLNNLIPEPINDMSSKAVD